MPKWTEYKASALERGALAFELYMVRCQLLTCH